MIRNDINFLGTTQEVRRWLKNTDQNLTDTDIAKTQTQSFRRVKAMLGAEGYIKESRTLLVTENEQGENTAKASFNVTPAVELAGLVLIKENNVSLRRKHRVLLKKEDLLSVDNYEFEISAEEYSDFVNENTYYENGVISVEVYYYSELHQDLQNLIAKKDLLNRQELDLSGTAQTSNVLDMLNDDIDTTLHVLRKKCNNNVGGVSQGQRRGLFNGVDYG